MIIKLMFMALSRLPSFSHCTILHGLAVLRLAALTVRNIRRSEIYFSGADVHLNT
jgi:hypothetical protein